MTIRLNDNCPHQSHLLTCRQRSKSSVTVFNSLILFHQILNDMPFTNTLLPITINTISYPLINVRLRLIPYLTINLIYSRINIFTLRLLPYFLARFAQVKFSLTCHTNRYSTSTLSSANVVSGKSLFVANSAIWRINIILKINSIIKKIIV